MYHLTQAQYESKPTDKSHQYTSSYYSKGKVPDGRCLRPYYTDDNYEQRLTNGDYYNNQYFIKDVNEVIFHTNETTDTIKVIKKKQEYQNYLDAVKWSDVGQRDIIATMFAAKQMSIQEGMKRYKDEGKSSAMKEIRNLTENNCFGETDNTKLD